MSRILPRREFLLRTGGLAALAVAAPRSRGAIEIIKPRRLVRGDTVGLVSPAGATHHRVDVDIAIERLAALGLRAKLAPNALAKHGYLGGTDEQRAADINGMFADETVNAIWPLKGGWGCGRLLPMLDYEAIRVSRKLLYGFSDITALLLALYARSGLVSVHGPTANSSWNEFTTEHFVRLAFDAEAGTLSNPVRLENDLAHTEDRIRTIRPGQATGRLVGGNLTVLTSLLGSSYLPDWSNHILFLEDVGEDIYRIDRMMNQLNLAGVLEQLAGVIFGKCSRCESGASFSAFTLEEVLDHYLLPLHVPAFEGSMIGHITDKFTVPVGVLATMNAETGTIELLESTVD
jgi:muramoyltetrapeptide carboxypeptidase